MVSNVELGGGDVDMVALWRYKCGRMHGQNSSRRKSYKLRHSHDLVLLGLPFDVQFFLTSFALHYFFPT